MYTHARINEDRVKLLAGFSVSVSKCVYLGLSWTPVFGILNFLANVLSFLLACFDTSCLNVAWNTGSSEIERFPIFNYFDAFSEDSIIACNNSVQLIITLTCFSAIENAGSKWNHKEHLPSACVFHHDPFWAMTFTIKLKCSPKILLRLRSANMPKKNCSLAFYPIQNSFQSCLCTISTEVL